MPRGFHVTNYGTGHITIMWPTDVPNQRKADGLPSLAVSRNFTQSGRYNFMTDDNKELGHVEIHREGGISQHNVPSFLVITVMD
jgi:hypothetical protein